MEGADRIESVAMGEFPVDGEDAAGYLAGWIGGLRTRPALQGVILGGHHRRGARGGGRGAPRRATRAAGAGGDPAKSGSDPISPRRSAPPGSSTDSRCSSGFRARSAWGKGCTWPTSGPREPRRSGWCCPALPSRGYPSRSASLISSARRSCCGSRAAESRRACHLARPHRPDQRTTCLPRSPLR